MELDLAYTAAGFVVGLIVGLTGIGGGALMTPLLVLGFGVNAATAVGTDLIYAAVTKCGGVAVYGRRGLVKWHIVGRLLLGSIPGALITIWVLSRLSVGDAIESVINATLSIALVLTSLALFFRGRLMAAAETNRWPELRERLRPWRASLTTFMGLLLGVLVTISSVGAGALGTAVLVLLYPRLSVPLIVGTDLAHAVILAGVAGFGHFHLGTVDFVLLGALLLGSMPGVFIGSHLGVRLPDRVVRPVMASMLLVVGLRFAI